MTIRRRQDTGRWQGRYRGTDGKERSQDFSTRSEAKTWVEEQNRRVRRGDWTDPTAGRITLGELWPLWLGSRSIKEKTRADYESLWATCLEPHWGATRLDRITALAVQTWVAGLQSRSGNLLSASRRRQAHGLLASVLEAGVSDGRLPRNPARAGAPSGRGGYLPKIPHTVRRRYLTHVEVDRLAGQCSDNGTLILLLAYCGLRWGEAVALRASDIDLLRSRIHVQRSVGEVRGSLIYGATKTHQAREVSVPGFLHDSLMAATAGKSSDDLVFTTPSGAPLRSANFRQRVFLPALCAAGIEPLRIHDLRHTAAGLAVDAGANVKGVQRMLGHADAAMTLNTYADLFDGHLDAVASRLHEAHSAALADSVRTGGADVLTLPGRQAG